MHLTKDTTQSSTDTCIYNGMEIIVNRREINFVSKLLYSRSNFITENKIAKKNYGFYFKRHKYSPILLVISMNFRKKKQSDRFFYSLQMKRRKEDFRDEFRNITTEFCRYMNTWKPKLTKRENLAAIYDPLSLKREQWNWVWNFPCFIFNLQSSVISKHRSLVFL